MNIPNTKEKILTLLEQAQAWISGEAISRELGISRAAVAKHVGILKNDGNAIQAATRKGYRLLARRDGLDGEALAATLKTRSFGKHGWTHLTSTPSTNLVAARLAGEGAREGHVVFAETQTQGRGRKGCTWISVPRGIQCSVVLYPEAACWNAEACMQQGAAAVADAVRALTGLDAVFKMPNDVLIHGKKIAGVLVETGYRGGDPEWAVIGVGCNVNSLPDDFPDAVRETTTSILIEAGAPLSRSALLAAMLERLEAAYTALCAEKPAGGQ
ncbi:biotin--[acetyl-CoA-carboxylase] ligase [Megalodesulfovibrio paquesii]